MVKTIARFPVISFIVIAYSWTWCLAYFIKQSVYFPILGLLGPSVAAIIVSFSIHQIPLAKILKGKFTFFRKDIFWYLVAILLPLTLLIPIYILYTGRLEFSQFKLRTPNIIDFIVAILIFGEEVGWRGFLLPHMLQRFTPMISSIFVGIIWAFWHLANFLIPEFPHYKSPFEAYLLIVIAYSILFTWIYLKTSGSLFIATIFHAALNIFSLEGIEIAKEYWLRAVVYSVFAGIVAISAFRNKKPLDDSKHASQL